MRSAKAGSQNIAVVICIVSVVILLLDYFNGEHAGNFWIRKADEYMLYVSIAALAAMVYVVFYCKHYFIGVVMMTAVELMLVPVFYRVLYYDAELNSTFFYVLSLICSGSITFVVYAVTLFCRKVTEKIVE
jgi:hypothetical protein